MPASFSIFLDFHLPTATTWFYFSFLLAVALFFKFARLWSVRNLDVVMMFLLVPGLLLVQAARPQPAPIEQQPAVQIASLIGESAMSDSSWTLAGPLARFTQQCGPALDNPRWLWFGYLWLLVGSGYFFCRCLVDLILVQRPALGPNLHLGGLAWLAGALLICMLAVAYRQVERALPPASLTASAPPVVSALESLEQPVFAVTVLWREWPAWAVAILALTCHLAVLISLILIGWRHFQDLAAGMSAVTFYLLLPYTGMSVGQLPHVLPMALFLGVVVAYRYPSLTGCLLGVATAATYFPLLVFPLWLSFYRGRGAGRFALAFLLALALCLVNIGLTLRLNEELEPSVQAALDSAAWQPWKVPTTEGFWTGVHWAYRIPVFLGFLSFVGTTLFWPAPKNLAQVIALSAAVFISLQWWVADQGGVYVLWYVPLLLLLVFRPNLQDCVAPSISSESDWLARSRRWTLHTLRRIINRPEPVSTKSL